MVGLVPEGVNSHTFELIPSDIIKFNDADLIIIDKLNLEANIEKTATNATKNPNIHLLKLGDKQYQIKSGFLTLVSQKKKIS